MAKTPLEQAIAEQTDRRARYDAKMRKAGFVRLSIWCPASAVDEVKALIKARSDG